MKRKYATLAIALSASMIISPAASVSAASYTTGPAPKLISENGVTDTVAPVAQFNIDGTLTDIVNKGHYNVLPNLKFHDNVALGSYTLNEHESPTKIEGNRWGDGNLQNIQKYLNIGNGKKGKNTLVVSDEAGNEVRYTFYLDQTAPKGKISYSPSNDKMSTEKTVTLKANEPVKPIDDGWTEVDGSGGKEWTKLYTKAQKDTVTFTDRAGNTSPLSYEVKRIESEKLSADVSYSNNSEATTQDVIVTITTNLECSVPQGWETVPGSTKRNEFQKTFSENTTETVTLTSLGGQKINKEIQVTNIQKEVTVNFYDEENNRQAGEVTVTVPKDKGKETVEAALVLDKLPQDYVYAGTDTEFAVRDGYVYVPVKLTKETKEISINYWDNILHEQACTGTMNVPYYAETVNASDIPLPEGYEFIGNTETPVTINDGWIWADVKKSDITVGVNYWDIENDTQVSEDTITVSGYDTAVNTSKLQIPEGYELVSTGDIAINGGWLWVELKPVEKPQETKDAVVKIHFVDAFGNPIDGIEPIELTKNGVAGEYAHFQYGTDWVLPEGYTFASYNDESIAKQDLTIKYGETLDTLEIGIVQAEKAVLKITLTDEFETVIDEIELTKTGEKGDWASFVYGQDWSIPEGYEFATKNDEIIANQNVLVKYGEVLDTFTVAIVPVSNAQ